MRVRLCGCVCVCVKMLEEYWASTVIFIRIFSQCIGTGFSQFACVLCHMRYKEIKKVKLEKKN